MYEVDCKNIFVSNNEQERKETFNKLWQNIVNLIINR